MRKKLVLSRLPEVTTAEAQSMASGLLLGLALRLLCTRLDLPPEQLLALLEKSVASMRCPPLQAAVEQQLEMVRQVLTD